MEKRDLYVRLTSGLSGFSRRFLGTAAALLTTALSVLGLLQTCEMNTENEFLENIVYRPGYTPFNLLALLAGLLLIGILWPRLARVKPMVWTALLCAWVLALGAVWVLSAQSAPTEDSFVVTDAARRFAGGDYGYLAPEEPYFRNFPYQLGYVLYSELLIRLLRLSDNFLALELVNVICLAGAYAGLLRLSGLLFPNRRVRALTAFLLAGCLQPVLFCTFLYGNIPGLLAAVWAVSEAVAFFRGGRWREAALSALCIGLAAALKLNNIIVLVALVIIAALHGLRCRRLRNLPYIALAAALSLGLGRLAVAQYEWRAAVRLGDGVPMISWAAMGLGESAIQPGWYDAQATIVNFDANGRDAAKAAEVSRETVKQRLHTFAADPGYAARFFYRKTASQWNEPTYQSLWTNQVRGLYAPRRGVARLLCEGGGDKPATAYMGIYQFFVFACAAAALWRLSRRRRGGENEALLLLPLIVFGGFLYHLLFEAKSQYILPYFIWLIPLAAYGAFVLTVRARRKLAAHRRARKKG